MKMVLQILNLFKKFQMILIANQTKYGVDKASEFYNRLIK